MQSRSALARLQQAITLCLAAAALAWLTWRWPTSPMQAIAGFFLLVLGHSVFLAVEFIALRVTSRADAQLLPSWRELLRAWFAETVTAPQVFCWRQPFRWRTEPDNLTLAEGSKPRCGVVFIHGFFCNRGFWNPWMKAMREEGRCYAAVNLEPIFGSIDEYAPLIDDAVRRVTAATGIPCVLVCHSMGGVAARAWLRTSPSARRTHRVVTIGTPHRGTWLARFSHLRNGRQMQLEGEWLRALSAHEGGQGFGRFTCWYSNCDNIVFPVRTATLPGADNRLVRGAAHVEMAFHPVVVQETLGLVASEDTV